MVDLKVLKIKKMNREKYKILIIEDDQDLIDMLTIRLESGGYKNITYALDGLEGYNTARLVKPDLIVLDILMPKMNGYKVCGLLKNDIRYNKIKIIMYTVKASNKDLKIGKEMKADVYLVKGMHGNDLLTTVNQLLEDKK